MKRTVKPPQNLNENAIPAQESRVIKADLQLALVERKSAFLEAFDRANGNLSKALKSVELTRKEWAAWLELDPDFKVAYEAIREEHLDEVEEVLPSLALDEKTPPGVRVTAADKYLAANRPDKYGKGEGSGKGGAPVIHIHFAPKPSGDGMREIDVKASSGNPDED